MPRRPIVLAVCVALLCAAGVGVAIHAAPGSAESDPGVCLKRPLRAMVGHGKSPGGREWSVVAHLRNDGKCRTRLLQLSFYPYGRSGINWRPGYGVPIGASLSSTFVISSEQLREDGVISYSGLTSAKVALVEASTRNGGWVKIEPVRPQTRKLPRWLRNVRYFMAFLPATSGKVERIRVRDRAGRVLYQGRESVFGEFDDVGVL
jgi:hypothetical protein